jgi:hypothetical protein
MSMTRKSAYGRWMGVAAENWMSARWCALAGAGAGARVRSLVAGAVAVGWPRGQGRRAESAGQQRSIICFSMRKRMEFCFRGQSGISGTIRIR